MTARFLTLALLLLGLTVVSTTTRPANAGDNDNESRECNPITRRNVARCAVAASLAARAEQYGLSGIVEGRRTAAKALLPSNPALSIQGGYPIEPGLTNRPALWSATLSQEIEIAGQRSARLRVVDAEQHAQQARAAAARRDAAADALLLYFDNLSAKEEVRLAKRLGALALALQTLAKGRAQGGVSSGVEAQLATAAATRLLQGQVVAEQRLATTRATLVSALGANTNNVEVLGELDPLPPIEGATSPSFVESAIQKRSEMVIALADHELQQRRVTLYERLRVPNPTLSVFVRNDWIGERSIGVGLGLPIPLPNPVGKTYAGEINEANALALRANVEAERIRRNVRLEIAKALEAVASRTRQVDLYGAEQIRESEETLRNIASEIETGRLGLREALFSQQSLIDYLFAFVEAKRQLCFASVELARVAGVPLDQNGVVR